VELDKAASVEQNFADKSPRPSVVQVSSPPPNGSKPTGILVKAEERAIGSVSTQVYTDYWRSAARWPVLVALFAAMVGGQVLQSLCTIRVLVKQHT
jgi:hypothetical protein